MYLTEEELDVIASLDINEPLPVDRINGGWRVVDVVDERVIFQNSQKECLTIDTYTGQMHVSTAY